MCFGAKDLVSHLLIPISAERLRYRTKALIMSFFSAFFDQESYKINLKNGLTFLRTSKKYLT